MTFGVRSLRVGSTDMRGPELFWMSDWDVRYPLCFQAVLIEGADVCALVNTSPPVDLDPVHNEFPRLRWALPGEGRLEREPHEHIEAALARASLEPADLTHVILTPLELYTTGTLDRFEHAQICISRRGWVHFHTTHDHWHDQRWRSIPRAILTELVTDSWPRVRLLDDEDEIAPGLRTWWAGVHHRETIVVEVDTAEGVVCISDAYFYFENIEQNRLLGLNESMEEAAVAYERVRRTADHLLPLHDPRVFERYPDGVIARRAGA